jgi:hypothetical protein
MATTAADILLDTICDWGAFQSFNRFAPFKPFNPHLDPPRGRGEESGKGRSETSEIGGAKRLNRTK